MKSKLRLIITIFALFLTLISASLAYRKLSKENEVIDSSEEVLDLKEKAIGFYIYDNNEQKVYLDDFTGVPVIINFWTSWCSPCQQELPSFEKMYQEYGDKINFMMVNLTADTRETKEKADKLVNENGYSFIVYYDLDGNAASNYNISSIPVTIFIDKDGYIRKKYVGAINETTLENIIGALLKQ